MAVIALGARSSTLALPTGKILRVIGGGPDGVITWPGDTTYFYANTSQTRAMQVGPFTITETCNLCARAWLIHQATGAAWDAGVMMLRLTDGAGTEVSDLNVHARSYTYNASESASHGGGGWRQHINETCYYVGPGSYFVQMLGGGGSGQYYVSSVHIGMVGWTLGEGAT